MTFEEIQQRYRALTEQRRNGRLDPQAFSQAVQELRTQDAQGRWWQIDPGSGGWLLWNGSAWEPAELEATAAAPARPASPLRDPLLAAPLRRGSDAGPDPRALAWLRHRSQRWWDALSVAGGAAAGYLWFTYSSVRGFGSPIPSVVLALLPLALMLLVPKPIRRSIGAVIGELGRRGVDGIPAERRPGILGALRIGWPLLAILLLLLWLFGDRNPNGAESPDLTTPLLMVGIPVVLALFRYPIDGLLGPIQPLRRRIPPLTRVGVSLVLPMCLGFVLAGIGQKEYGLAHWNMVLGTLGSYAVLHDPAGRGSGGYRSQQPGRPRPSPSAAQGALLLVVAGLSFVLPSAVRADDCLFDPFNLNDCLRTIVTAPVISGIASTLVSVLVNGGDLVQVLLPPDVTIPVTSAPEVSTGADPKDPREELREIQRQWEDASKGGDPSDPAYQRLKKQYDDYMDWLNQKIAASDAAAQAAATTQPEIKPDIEYTFPDGRRTTLVYDASKGGYVNVLTNGVIRPEDLNEWDARNRQTEQSNDDWRQRNKQLNESGLDSQSLALKKMFEAQAKRMDDLLKEIKKDRDARWEFIRDSQLSDVKRYSAQGDRNDRLVGWLQTIEKAADMSIELIDNLATFGGVCPNVTTAIKYGYYVGKGGAFAWSEVQAKEVKYNSQTGASDHIMGRQVYEVAKTTIGDSIQDTRAILIPRTRILLPNLLAKVEEDDRLMTLRGKALRYKPLGAGLKSFIAGQILDQAISPIADYIYKQLPQSPR